MPEVLTWLERGPVPTGFVPKPHCDYLPVGERDPLGFAHWAVILERPDAIATALRGRVECLTLVCGGRTPSQLAAERSVACLLALIDCGAPLTGEDDPARLLALAVDCDNRRAASILNELLADRGDGVPVDVLLVRDRDEAFRRLEQGATVFDPGRALTRLLHHGLTESMAIDSEAEIARLHRSVDRLVRKLLVLGAVPTVSDVRNLSSYAIPGLLTAVASGRVAELRRVLEDIVGDDFQPAAARAEAAAILRRP